MIKRASRWLASAALPSTETTAVSGNRRIVELDAFRGIAAVIVTIHHFTSPVYVHRLFPQHEHWLFLFNGGLQGVYLFFMISGFVILMTLDRKKSVVDFGVSRAIRLYPAYWTAVLLTFAVVRIYGLPGREVGFTSALWNLTMLQGFLAIPAVDGVYWTLHCELLFYILMAFIVAIGMRRNLLALVMIIVIGNLAYRGFGIPVDLPGSWRIKVLPQQMHWFAIGILFYEMRTRIRPRHLVMLAVCLFAGCCSTYATRLPGELSSYSGSERMVQVMCAMGLVATMFVATRYRVPFLTSRGLVFLGTISYSFYLVHRNIGIVIIRAGYRRGLSEGLSIALAFVSVFALACAVTFIVERPAMRFLRSKYERWKNPAKADVASPSSS